MNSRKNTQRIVSAALTSLFMLNQTMMISAFATNITGVANTPGGTGSTYTIDPTAVINHTNIGYTKYKDFDLSKGDTANLNFIYGNKGIDTFVNLVDNKINIEGVVNSMRNGNFYNGKAIFVSPKGMIVGASGVLNVGSLGAYTPRQDLYDKLKYNPNDPNDNRSKPLDETTLNDFMKVENAGNGTVAVNGRVLAARDIDVVSSHVDVPGKMVAKGTDVVEAYNQALFDQLVNTSSMKSAKSMNRNGGKITFTTSNGTNVSGNVINHGTGVVSMNNINNGGLKITGNVGSNGDVELKNSGKDGILIASTGRVDSNKDILMNDKSAKGIAHQGLSKADNDVKITANGGNVVIGDRTSNNNYITAGKNIDINVNKGSVLNYESQQADAKVLKYDQGKTLLKADGNLNIDVTDGTIGLETGDSCTGGYCTGISNDEHTRDYGKSINGNIKGTVTERTTDSTAAKQNDYVINYAALNSDMNIDSIKADGRVILTTDYNQNDKTTRYDMLNASKNAAKANVEGYGLSLIASGNIGTKDKALTFNQTRPGDLANAKAPIPKSGYGMDVLANEDINIKGLDDKYNVNNVCSMISREGNINAEFAGNAYIDEVTAEKDLNLIARGKSLEVNHLGTVPRTPVDYFGPRQNGLADNPYLPNGGYTGEGERDAIPNNATLKALDINKTIRPNGTDLDGYYGYADSTVRVDNGRLDNGKLDIVADNIYANGVYTNLGKDGFTKSPDPSTGKIEGSNGIPTGHAVRPDDVTGIGRDEHERNYYYPQGDGDGTFDGVPSNVDDDDDKVDATPLDIPDEKPSVTPTTSPEPTDTPTETPTDPYTDAPTDVPTDAPTSEPTDMPTEPVTDGPSDEVTEVPTDVPTDNPSDLPSDFPSDNPSDNPSEQPADPDTDAPTEAPSEPVTPTPSDPVTDTPTIEPHPSVNPDTPTNPSVRPEEDEDGRIMYNQRIDDSMVEAIDKRQFIRYNVSNNTNPIALERGNGIESLLDVSRGGVSVTHNNELKVGDVVPVHIAYGALDIKANVKVVSATTHRAGAKFVNLDQATANQILYLNMVLDEVNKVNKVSLK